MEFTTSKATFTRIKKTALDFFKRRFFFAHYFLEYFGRSPTGRAIRCNALFVTSQNISAAIPNARTAKLKFKIQNVLTGGLLKFQLIRLA
jgi:hypothetical protein